MRADFKITINTHRFGIPVREYVKAIHIIQQDDELMIAPITHVETIASEYRAMSSTFDIMQHLADILNWIHPSWEAKVE